MTGFAGTGKTTLLRHLLEEHRGNSAVVAPTGVAAVQIGGRTIHSFFGIRPNCTVEEAAQLAPARRRDIYRSLKILFVDEVSMVRSDLWDCMEAFLRVNGPQRGQAFGGVKMICFGDLFQLPPVVTKNDRAVFEEYYPSEFFFDAKTLAETLLEIVELTRIFRQTDAEFIDLLNAIRVNAVSEEQLAQLNSRAEPGFQPSPGVLYVTLTTTRQRAAEVNESHLERLPGDVFTFTGSVSGDFDLSGLPTETELRLKTGAQVMMVNNDPSGRWINGTLGKVVHLPKKRDKPLKKDEDPDLIRVQLEGGEVVEVEPYTWEFSRLEFDRSTRKLASVPIGDYKQIPLRLAWAVTIHKSQGLTFDRVIIDLDRGAFASGQLYVALSRCRTLGGITLRRKIRPSDIRTDPRIIAFITNHLYRQVDARMSPEAKITELQSRVGVERDVILDYLRENGHRVRLSVRPLSVQERVLDGKPTTVLRAHAVGWAKPLLLDIRRILDIDGQLLSQ